MKIIHQNGYSHKELMAFRPIIYRNVLECAQSIVLAMKKLGVDPVLPANRVNADKISGYKLYSEGETTDHGDIMWEEGRRGSEGSFKFGGLFANVVQPAERFHETKEEGNVAHFLPCPSTSPSTPTHFSNISPMVPYPNSIHIPSSESSSNPNLYSIDDPRLQSGPACVPHSSQRRSRLRYIRCGKIPLCQKLWSIARHFI